MCNQRMSVASVQDGEGPQSFSAGVSKGRVRRTTLRSWRRYVDLNLADLSFNDMTLGGANTPTFGSSLDARGKLQLFDCYQRAAMRTFRLGIPVAGVLIATRN